MRLIDADELLDIYHHDADCDLYEALDITPTIQAVPLKVLDTISTKIKECKAVEYSNKEFEKAYRTGLARALIIVDKYRKEQE